MSAAAAVKYGRVLLKLSGEALAGDQGFGIAPPVIAKLTEEIRGVHAMGISLGLVIGGGTSCAAPSPASRGWTASPPITWGCWPP